MSTLWVLEGRGDIGLFITLVPKFFIKYIFFVCQIKLSVQTFQPLIIIYIRGNHHWPFNQFRPVREGWRLVNNIHSGTKDFLFWYPKFFILEPKVFYSGTQGFQLEKQGEGVHNQTMHMYILMYLIILFTFSIIDTKPYDAY